MEYINSNQKAPTYLDTSDEQKEEIGVLGELLPQENGDKCEEIILASCDAIVKKLLSLVFDRVVDMDATAGRRARVIVVPEEHFFSFPVVTIDKTSPCFLIDNSTLTCSFLIQSYRRNRGRRDWEVRWVTSSSSGSRATTKGFNDFQFNNGFKRMGKL